MSQAPAVPINDAILGIVSECPHCRGPINICNANPAIGPHLRGALKPEACRGC
jgi:hypothetical protein